MAFFPVYPLLSWAIGGIIGFHAAALLIPNIALAATLVLMVRYTRVRWPDGTREQRAVVWILFGFWPLGLFYRMPYAESLFVCGVVLVLYGMERRWPVPLLALTAGLLTAVRPVGVAVSAAVLWHAWWRSDQRPPLRVAALAGLVPAACWGLLVYMAYLTVAFDAPFAFAQTQDQWTLFAPPDRSPGAKAWSLLTLEPIWGLFVPGARQYWERWNPKNPVFGLQLWNPVLFVLACLLVCFGRWKRWLTGAECVASTGLLLIPYVTRAFEMSMASHARFASVVVCQYLVLGRLLAFRPVLALGLCGVTAVMLVLFSALYSQNYWLF